MLDLSWLLLSRNSTPNQLQSTMQRPGHRQAPATARGSSSSSPSRPRPRSSSYQGSPVLPSPKSWRASTVTKSSAKPNPLVSAMFANKQHLLREPREQAHSFLYVSTKFYCMSAQSFIVCQRMVNCVSAQSFILCQNTVVIYVKKCFLYVNTKFSCI